jgi:carboxylesterase type B
VKTSNLTQLRVCLQEPQAPDPWKDVRDAQTERSVAPQIDIFLGKGHQGDEDCLFLNVYTPKVTHEYFCFHQ